MCWKESLFFLLTFTLISAKIETCGELSDLEVTLESDHPYLPLKFSCVIEYGYKFLITVKQIQIDGNCSEYLVIKPGLELDDDHKAFVFTQKLKKEREFVIPSNELYIELVTTNKCDKDKEETGEFGRNPDLEFGFKLTYKRIGKNEIVTTPNPITPTPWPIPSANDSIHLTVYLAGHNSIDFLNRTLMKSFKKAVAGMGNEYCKTNDVAIHLSNNITEVNVQISELKTCRYSWPDSENCVFIRFALPVIQVLPNSSYQLVTSHLAVMWERYSTKYLTENGFEEYEIPDTKEALTWWAVILGVATGIFLILILAGISFNYIKNRFFSEEEDESNDKENLPKNDYLNSAYSLAPDRLQSEPNMNENFEINRDSLYLDDECLSETSM